MSPPSDERPRRRPDASTRIPSKPLPPPALDEAEPSIFGPSGSADGPSRADLPIGIDGYSVHDVLGEGGMGRVYLGRDEDLQRPIALKTPRRAEPEHGARFIAEAQVVSQLQHPGIVPIFGLGRSRDGRPYYSMPVVRGRTLQDVIADTAAGDAEAIARWSLTRLMTVFLQVCGAVGHAHAKGVLHRDLKPANIMVGQHGEVRVLDWGLANVVAVASSAT